MEAVSYGEDDYINIERDILGRVYPDTYMNELGRLDDIGEDWRLLVELNARLSEYSIGSWGYRFFLKERDDVMYAPGVFYKSGKNAGNRKPRNLKELMNLWNELFPNDALSPITRNPYSSIKMLVDQIAKLIVEEKYKDTIIEPDLDELRDFLSENKEGLNNIIKNIRNDQRSLVEWDKLSYNIMVQSSLTFEEACHESKKFANPIYTVFALSNVSLSISGRTPFNWSKGKEKIGKNEPIERHLGLDMYGRRESDYFVWPSIIIKPTEKTIQSVRDSSIKIMKLLLEFIDLDVLNSRHCINPICEIIINANKNFPNDPNHPSLQYHFPLSYAYDSPEFIQLSYQMFKILVESGLDNQSLSNTGTFDVLGNYCQRDIIRRNPLFISPEDTYRELNPRNLVFLCHSTLRYEWLHFMLLYYKKKKLQFVKGADDPNSPLYYLDHDIVDKILKERSHSLGDKKNTESLRRQTFANWSGRAGLAESLRRRDIARGLEEATDLEKESMGIVGENLDGYPFPEDRLEEIIEEKRSVFTEDDLGPTYSPDSPRLLSDDEFPETGNEPPKKYTQEYIEKLNREMGELDNTLAGLLKEDPTLLDSSSDSSGEMDEVDGGFIKKRFHKKRTHKKRTKNKKKNRRAHKKW